MKNHIVFGVSFALVFLLVIATIIFPQTIDKISNYVHSFIIEHFGWGYLLSAFFFLIFCFVLAFGPYGNIKLGKDFETPTYSYFGWISMLFAAGMGIGLIFWGVAEPLKHYIQPPQYLNTRTGEAATFAMKYSFFHWGFHPWAIYIIISLSLAYFSFRRGMPTLISSCFYPLLGEKIYGVTGYLIDILAVFATIFGVATSLGLGALQINSGLNFVVGIPDNDTFRIIIIVIVTILFIASSISGVSKGIQILSKTNIVLAVLLMLFLLTIGPTSYILNVFTSTMGKYISSLVEMSLNSNTFEGYKWTKTWTLFYWAWWISWSPFVGVFIASVSRGRTIREFVLAVLLVPSLFTFLWFSVFGGAVLNLELEQGVTMPTPTSDSIAMPIFNLFSNFPFTNILSGIAILLLIVFFITSADSATYVLGMMTSGGNRRPSNFKKITWGITQSLVACSLLISGGLVALQRMAITAALPFTFVILILTYNLWIALKNDKELENLGQKTSN